MNAAAIVTMVNALLGLVESFLPTIQGLVVTGQVTVAQQQALKDRIDALRAQVGTAGPLVNDGTAP